MDINGLHEIVRNLREDFHSFKSNDFHLLQTKVDKLGSKVAWIVGLITAFATAISLLIRFL